MRGLSRKEIKNLAGFALQRLREGRLTQVAGSLTFTSILAIVPILAVAFAIFTAFPLFTTFRSSLEAYFVQNLMPKGIANTILGYLTQFATKASRVSAISAVALLITSILTMATIDKAFNQIWHVKRSRPWAQRLLVYWAIITLGPLLIGFSMSLTSYLFAATNTVVNSVPFLGVIFYALVSLLLTTGAYTLLYVLVPNRPVSWRDAATGGLVAALAFEVAKRLFAEFISHFPTYTVVYGALAAIPIFLVWVYLSWLITLMGAVITAALPVVKFERWWHQAQPGAEFDDAVNILLVLAEARETEAGAAVDQFRLRERTRLGMDEIEALLSKLAQQGWVGRLSSDAEGMSRQFWSKKYDALREPWMLLLKPELINLFELYQLLVYQGQRGSALSQLVHAGLQQSLAISLADFQRANQAAIKSGDQLKSSLTATAPLHGDIQ